VDYLLEKYRKATGEKKGFLVVALSGRAGAGFIESIKKELSVRRAGGEGILLVPMFPREDKRICQKLAKQLDGCVAEDLSGRDLIAIMEKSNQVIGMRLHSLIFAFLAGVSFVGVGEDSKIESFCRENGGAYYTDQTV
jgi:polysaccharide pyruvyl transferase WcaK-like protein